MITRSSCLTCLATLVALLSRARTGARPTRCNAFWPRGIPDPRFYARRAKVPRSSVWGSTRGPNVASVGKVE
jgi:hypothetical protein